MCGLAGFFDLSVSTTTDVALDSVRAMADALRHRGPDGDGQWVDAQAGIALGHRRLSIIDLSQGGRQPMASNDGRIVVSYNGEIYNYQVLRQELEGAGVTFSSESDTEVLVEAVRLWGLEATLPKLVGMFAMAVWDADHRTLSLARDRLGIKPLYWGQQGDCIFFASEPQALFAHPGFRPEIDRAALTGLVAYNYVPGPSTVFCGISNLEPGSAVRIDSSGARQSWRYWSLSDVAARGVERPCALPYDQAVDALEALLCEAVSCRMVSDVPLGALLSGGVDSSAVVALMQKLSPKPIETFSIGFEEFGFNEAAHAREVAEHLGTHHHDMVVTAQDALDVVAKLADLYAEPFADSSQIPTYLVSHMARQHVTVALSGDGGDEVFAGYNRYRVAADMWPRLMGIPAPLRRAMGHAIGAVPPAMWDGLARAIPQNSRPPQLGSKMGKVADLMRQPDLDAFYARVVRFWDQPQSVVADGQFAPGPAWSEAALGQLGDVERMQFLDTLTYLPDDILTKVDRASMAVGLEARVPLIDHRVVEFAWSLPRDYKIQGGVTKRILRDVLYRHVPRALIDRPKMGFGIPLGAWLKGPLRDWAEDLLSESALRETGLFAPQAVRNRWHRHLSGTEQGEYALWSVLMAQAWYRRWM